ncbi:heavy metal translocating P-type ATPase [Methylocystis sp. 9N]|uniref:P-type Zn(2+) transporter n=1 Tax=Methylocystis borbori TaxID=3118750 RepID=A0ABU7XDA1_9HYPH
MTATALEIVHELPKRLRLRLAASPEVLARAAASLRDLPGVSEVRANRACASLAVSYDGQTETREAILARARHPLTTAREAWQAPAAANPTRLTFAAAAAVASLFMPVPLARAITLANVAGVVLRGAAQALRATLKTDALDALAIGLPTARGEFVTANVARFLLELAGYIETTTVQRSDELLRSLLLKPPDDVWIERDDGELARVPFAELKGGERVVVGAGETIPVDGHVQTGDAYVDQSTVTGESLPLPRGAGDQALAGGVVTAGRLVILAERVGAATTTGRIAGYIQEGLDRPSNIQTASSALADKRVGITLASAGAVFALTGDLRRIESVFMVDYSCAVKLGTPIAIKSAMYRAARMGCLVKSGSAIEALAGIDTVVFDKTGTLTHNTLEVTDICPLDRDIDEERVAAMIASLGEHTSHPIARAVVQLAEKRHLAHIPHEEVSFIVGHGVEARVEGRRIRFGSRHFLEDDERVSFAGARDRVKTLEAEGKSLLYIAADNRPIAVFALRDRLRAESAETLARLRAQGVKRLIMITGDRQAPAMAFAKMLGLDAVHYEQRPEDKARVIAALKQEGCRIAYVGDGVNDGPGLMEADVGVSMPRAADIARATAGIVLLEDRLDSLVTILSLAQNTMRLIHSNFAVAVGVNTAILAGAASGVLAPVASAALHNGATIAVLLRALLGGRSTQQGLGSGHRGI